MRCKKAEQEIEKSRFWGVTEVDKGHMGKFTHELYVELEKIHLRSVYLGMEKGVHV